MGLYVMPVMRSTFVLLLSRDYHARIEVCPPTGGGRAFDKTLDADPTKIPLYTRVIGGKNDSINAFDRSPVGAALTSGECLDIPGGMQM